VPERYAIMFAIKPGSEQAVARILSSYGRPQAEIDEHTRLLSTTVFMKGTWVVRVLEIEGELFKVMRHLGTQPEIRATEEALNPHLAEQRDLSSVDGIRSFYMRSFMDLVTHRSGGAPTGNGSAPAAGAGAAGERPPPVLLLEKLTGYWVSQSLAAFSELGIPDALRDGPRKVGELAAGAGVEAGPLGRLLRALATVGVVRTLEDEVELTPLGTYLVRDDPATLVPLVRMSQEGGYRAWGELLVTLRTGRPAYEAAHGADFQGQVDTDSELGRLFDQAMASVTAQVRERVPVAYDFSPAQRVIDVGGGDGGLLAAILRAHPHLTGAVYDVPRAAEAAGRRFAAPGLGGRAEAIPGSFFDSVPAGADRYILSRVLTSWDDEVATGVLRKVREAVTPDGRLLIVEMLIPPGDAPFFGKWLDLHLLVLRGGAVRSEEDHRRLLSDAGFRLDRVIPTGAVIPVSIIEAAPL